MASAAATGMVDAPPAVVYGILSDYRHGHPAILPARYFSGLEVESGGVGEGTRIRFRLHLLGRTRTMRASVSEPEPGRVLAETDLETGGVTRFVVEPVDGGDRSRVTIRTEWTPTGVKGVFERLVAPPLLRQVYAAELRQLAEQAALRAHSPTRTPGGP